MHLPLPDMAVSRRKFKDIEICMQPANCFNLSMNFKGTLIIVMRMPVTP